MSTQMKHIINIISANKNQRLALFVGAGISKCVESEIIRLPSWGEIIEDLKKDLDISKDNDSDYLKIAQLYYLEFGEYTYYEKIKSYFSENLEPSIIHKLLFELNPHYIITTNWDNLLETTIKENSKIYDTVCSDKDLVKSLLDKKVIKMHGDFSHHNIIFKEDDYLNYSYNFPLIENYIKSILSTHTILFLGYSYNDNDLKHIVKWIQFHSSVKPPTYLLVFEDNPTQKMYLNNHGITTLLINDKNPRYSGLSDKPSRIATFFNLLLNNEEIDVSDDENSIIDYVYNKLIHLVSLNGILLDQIQDALSNCGFIYDNDAVILEFYSKILTRDIDKKKREIYKNFIEIVKNNSEHDMKNEKLKLIYEILLKANISGISISSDITTDGKKEYINIKDEMKNIIDESRIFKYLNYDYSKTLDRSVMEQC